jgi:TonB-dependent SusC/RagA subfamily outer membrane receptor
METLQKRIFCFQGAGKNVKKNVNTVNMKKSILIISFLALSYLTLEAQVEKEVTSEIKNIIVYTQGAQIESASDISLQQGQMVLKFTHLSPYINAESIRVEGDGSFTIQNVQHQTDYLNELEKNKEIDAIQKKIEKLQDTIEYEKTWLGILGDKLDFLKTNKEITGKQQAVSPEAFNSMNAIYGNNLESLNLTILKKERAIKDYETEMSRLNKQVESLNNKGYLPSGTIIVTIDSRQNKNTNVKLSYLVDNASWYPSYDIRFVGADKPLVVTFKANICQNTGIDWKNVNLVLSTSKTNISAQIPALAPFYLQFYTPQFDVSSALSGRVAGVQMDQNSGAPGLDNQIRIRGFSSLNSNNKPLYVVDGVPRDDISYLASDDIAEVNVLKDESATALYGSRGSNGVVVVNTKRDKSKSSVPLTIATRQETSNEYSVETPQTILSNNKISTITFKETNLTSSYEYQAIPLLSEHVFLIGKIADWYKADLLDGEANIYLENSYVGKSQINTHQFKDTLDISFGVDNNISIKREKLTDYSSTQFIGVNKKVAIAYKITVRNNKRYVVNTKIYDQVPVSTIKDIQVESVDAAGGKVNSDTGEVTWDLTLQPNETKELTIRYSVKYPKDKQVIID